MSTVKHFLRIPARLGHRASALTLALAVTTGLCLPLAGTGIAGAAKVPTPPATPTQSRDVLDNLYAGRVTAPNYVAIGDSYTVATFAPTTIWEPCMRNLVDYPHMTSVGTALPLIEPACIGGSGSGYWYHSTDKLGNTKAKNPYRWYITKNSYLVSINLGLNDLALAYDKALLKKCVDAAVNNQDRQRSACEAAVGPNLDKIIKVLPRMLYGIYKDAKMRANPQALVVAVGYVEFFRQTGLCWDNALMGEADRAYINYLFKRVNQAVVTAARKAHVAFYIPASATTELSGNCGLPFYRSAGVVGLPELGYPLHPTFAGAARTAFALTLMYQRHLDTHPGLRAQIANARPTGTDNTSEAPDEEAPVPTTNAAPAPLDAPRTDARRADTPRTTEPATSDSNGTETN